MPTWCATRAGCSRCGSGGMPRAATRSRRRRASRPSSAASRSSWRSREPSGRCRHPADAAIPRHQGALSADHPVFPDGRLLRDVRGRRAARGARAWPHPHDEKQRRRGRGPAGRRPREGRRRVSSPPRRGGAPGGDLRAGGGPEARAGARADVLRGFRLASLDGRGVAVADRPALGAAGALMRYARELKPGDLPHVARPRIVRRGDVVPLDEMTRRNLELVEPLRPGTAGATLLEVLDGTVTPMGARLLRRWLLAPLVDPAPINARLDAVAVPDPDTRRRDRLREALDGVRDVERLAGRAGLGRAPPPAPGALRGSI